MWNAIRFEQDLNSSHRSISNDNNRYATSTCKLVFIMFKTSHILLFFFFFISDIFLALIIRLTDTNAEESLTNWR